MAYANLPQWAFYIDEGHCPKRLYVLNYWHSKSFLTYIPWHRQFELYSKDKRDTLVVLGKFYSLREEILFEQVPDVYEDI